MNLSRKVTASVLTIAMAASVFASCSKTSGGADVISEDDEWFDLTQVRIGEDVDPTVYEYGNYDYVGRYEDLFIYNFSAMKILPSDFDYETDNYSDYSVETVEAYDIEGNKLHEIDLMALVDSDLQYVYIDRIVVDEGQLKVSYSAYDENDNNVRMVSNVDLTTWEASPLENVEIDNEVEEQLNNEGSNEGDEIIGAYTITKYWFYSDGHPSYVLLLKDNDGFVKEFDFRELFPEIPIYDIGAIVDVGNDKALVCGYFEADSLFFMIDLNALTVTDVSEDLAWLGSEVDSLRNVEGLGCVVMKDDGLYSVDFDTHEISPLFIYSNSNVNLYDVSGFTPVSVTEDRAIFTGIAYPSNMNYNSVPTVLCIFDRAASNPNAGKTVITLASIDSYSYALCCAVQSFNENNGEYFIKFNTKYNIDDAITAASSGNNTNEDPDLITDQATSNLGNALAIDLMSGDGPDMIVNGAQFAMLNDESYLIDLSDYVNDNCSSADYFSNVFDAARTEEGALYQLPLSFYIEGISTAAENVDEGQIGFTFDEYQAFVEGPCNGSAPITGGKLSLFVEALNCMSDLMFENGAVNYDNEAFRALAEYTSEYVNEDLVSDDPDTYYQEEGAASLVTISDIDSYFRNVSSNNNVLLGIPSYDGRGPIIFGAGSIAVSANSLYREGCLAFVNELLGNESQINYGMSYGIPVNRTAFHDSGMMYIDSHNNELDSMLRVLSEAQLRAYGYATDRMEESDIDEFETVVTGLSGWYSTDGSVSAIIREEMPAYFSGQKTLDQVIPVLNDRVQTVLDERL